MSLETRSNSALFKRAEQLKRWEESETNREPLVVNGRERKIKFSAGCVFLAACKAGDKEEIQRLLKKGADIHTSDVDGLTALHQACIDDNLDLVEFLVENGADVNKGDNEGWTPLHATASCGFLSIAKYLIENGANVAAVNNDGELPMDVAESDAMEDMLQQQIEERGIDAESARTEEERLMMTDAKNWLSSGYIQDKTHPKTGATALHVAAAKGYLKVMDILIKAGADIDAKDLDGWTPLHAASHWGQREACEILVENFCDMNIKNCVGQTPFDVADNDVVKVLEDLRKKQASLPKENIINRRKNIQRKPPQPPEENIITGIENKKETKLVEPVKPKVPEVQQVELKIQPEPTHNQSNIDTDDDIDSLSTETSDTASSDVSGESEVSDEEKDLEKKNKANKEDTRLPVMPEVKQTVPNTPAPTTPPKQVTTNEGDESGLTSWRRSGSLRSRIAETPKANLTLKIAEKESPAKVTQPVLPSKTESSLEVGLRRTQSFEGDEKSFVPPVRDEESETQRKAHAKRVRETRRSTQGVTLEEIKSAEQLVKKKQQQQMQQSNQLNNSEPGDEVVVNVHSTVPAIPDSVVNATKGEEDKPYSLAERRPSWRLKVDNGSKFMLEDARKNENLGDVVVRKTAVVTPVTETGDTTVTLPLRKKTDDKESQENDSRTAQATQAAIQRRRRPKRRSTGVVHVDMDEIDPDRQGEGGTGGGGDTDDSLSLNNSESGGEQSEASSRLNSLSREEENKSEATENGEIDYKKLYEQSLIVNDRLREKLRTTEEELNGMKAEAEKNAAMIRNSLSESEKRERRAMERKLSEMEEELKQLQKLKSDNERLRAENRALTRVVSKLTASHTK
ncbi:protein phosphatase 1 regulatory subunit 12A isoform X7 [Cimex lectularius]|uniref:Protein phosphatase 1 regulatory subunit 12B n=1 Tax=Cimex lectularius TaxID=79782 RepID=A0A8I6SBQ7_CIMLE|nr:protein phosphatase 1 regulatory subunit 12A isoform X7 [Cimex lectularius]